MVQARKNYRIFIDFDNTITEFDTLDDMLERFAVDDSWVELEERWKRGDIGSHACLAGQMNCIRISEERLGAYLASIRIDPYFTKLVDLFEKRNIPVTVISDNFDYILEKVLSRQGVVKVPVLANKISVSGDVLTPEFPFLNHECRKCAHCKSTNVRTNTKPEEISVYIGDGRSDACATRHASLVFAKGWLAGHLEEKGRGYVPFKTLEDVYNYFQRSIT